MRQSTLFQAPAIAPQELEIVSTVEALKKDLDYLAARGRRWSGSLRRSTFARNLQGSNSIEGYNVTVDDAIAAIEGEDPLEPKNEAWLAVSGYRLAMTYVMQKADDPGFQYSVAHIHSLHYMMTSHDLTKHPGRWRPGAIFVHDDATRTRVYEGPPVEQVPALMDALVESLNDRENRSPALVQAAMAHLNLVLIHPFSDGNGRMARCLQTLVLARSGTTSSQFCSIEEYLGHGRNTRAYYDVLAKVGAGSWHPERDARPWIRFCLTAHFIQAMTLLRRARQTQKIYDELEDLLVTRRGMPDRVLLAMIDAAQGLRVRNATYRAAAEVGDVTAGRDLRALAEAGYLEARGEKRGRYYLATPLGRAIRERAAEPKEIADPFAQAAAKRPAR
jgi:Fic family protein